MINYNNNIKDINNITNDKTINNILNSIIVIKKSQNNKDKTKEKNDKIIEKDNKTNEINEKEDKDDKDDKDDEVYYSDHLIFDDGNMVCNIVDHNLIVQYKDKKLCIMSDEIIKKRFRNNK